MLIHRSLESVRNNFGCSGTQGQAGGSRVKCLLAVAAGVCICSAAVLLLAKLYTAYFFKPGTASPDTLAQQRSQSLQKQSNGPPQAAQSRTPQKQKRAARRIQANSGPLPVSPDDTAELPEKKQASGRIARQYHSLPDNPQARVKSVEPAVMRKSPLVRDAAGPEAESDAGQQSLDRHFALQAKRNERVLELEQALRAALNLGDSALAGERLHELLAVIGARSLGGLKWQGFYALRFGNWRTAETFYNQALARSPRDIQCRYNLALAQLKQGQSAAASVHYRRLKALAPRSAAVRRLAPYFEPR